MPTHTLPLLEILAELTGCQYLSDLRFLNAAQKDLLARVVKSLSAAGFSLAEWNDAACYITGAPHSYQMPQAAAAAITRHCRIRPQDTASSLSATKPPSTQRA